MNGGFAVAPADIDWAAGTVTVPGIPGPIQVQMPARRTPRGWHITTARITNPRAGQWALEIEIEED